YTTGTLERSGGTVTATVRVRDIGGSGLASLFSVAVSNPGTAMSVGEAIAQRLNNLVRAAEQARECDDQRKKSQFPRALDAARKALAIEPNLPAAHICIATVYEAQHMPLDSLLAAYQRAAKGDSSKAADSTVLKAALGAAQQVSDTQRLLFFSRTAVAHFPKSAAFWKALGSAYDLKGQKDSSVWAYKQSLKLDPTDVKASLL